MKTLAVLLIAILWSSCFAITFGKPISEGSVVSTGSQQPLISDGHDGTGAVSPSILQASKSMISLKDGKGGLTSVLIDSQLNLTWTTVGSSTIINPPLEAKNKIDSNLLNLTGLVTEGYLQNNQTNVIISFSNTTTLQKTEDNPALQGLFASSRKMYTSEHANSDMNFVATSLNYSTAFELAESPQVAHVWLDRNFYVCLNQSVPLIKNPTEWAAIEASLNRSVNGSGVKIAILDTGIDSTHPDFYFPNGTSKIVGAASFTGEPITDGYGHGTHCASIAAGTGEASNFTYVGVAPGAALMNVKVLDNSGQGQESWIISGIQWAVDNHANILSMSFGSNAGGDGTDPLSTTVNWATDQGAVCVVAAGNSGQLGMYTINSPGVAELAITVGASDKTDVVASFSSRGPTSDYRIKPDVVAPGVNIVAARASGTSMGKPVSQYYTMASGTSMATPHVAGAAALILDAHPSWSPGTIKMALANYAQNITKVDQGTSKSASVLDEGTGRIDVCKAANASAVGNSSISFGRVGLNAIYRQVFTLQNLVITTLNIALEAKAWYIDDGTVYNVALLNTSSLILSGGATGQVELSLDTSGALPEGYFEGIIKATFGDTSIRIPFFFCIISQLSVGIVDESGSKLMAAYVLIDAQTGQEIKSSIEDFSARFLIFHGTYIVQAMDLYELNPPLLDARISFIIHRKFSIGVGETMNLQLSLASANKLEVRTTDVQGYPLYLVNKQLLTPYRSMGYLSDMGALANQYIYLTNLSEYISPPCFFGFEGFPQSYTHWTQTGILTSEVDAYFIGWDLSTFGLSTIPSALSYANSELATLEIETMLPESSPTSTIWFNQIAGLWQSGFWHGYETHPGIRWTTHVLPYQYKTSPTASWSQLEWSCVYTFSTSFGGAPESYVIDRHFQPITKGENASYSIGKTPLLPQDVVDSPPYIGNGLYIPYYPLRVEKNLFIAKTNTQATMRLEVFKNSGLISNDTRTWDQASIPISQFLNTYGYGLYTFVVNTGTSFNYSSQNVAEYTINYASTSTDRIPPSITKIDCAPCFTKSDQPVEIQLTDNVGISSVSLSYSTDNGPYVPSNLNNLGNNLFSADLALPTGSQKLSLIIEASDVNGNKIRFTTDPAATRGYATRIDANLSGGTITGKLTVIGGSLLQPVYLKVKSNAQTMYTLTDVNGNFAFTVPPSFGFQIEIEMSPMGNYDGSSWVANFLGVQTEPAGVASIPGGGWYTQATDVVLTAPLSLNVSSNARYRFNYWDVDGALQGNGVNPITVHMDSNHTATAHYSAQYTILFTQAGISSDATGVVVIVNGNSKSQIDLPFALWVDSGLAVTYSYNDIVQSIVAGKRFKQVSVTGPASPITVTGPLTVTGNYKTQHYLTVSTDPAAVAPILGEGWYDESTYQTLTAPQVNGYQFNYWDVDGSSQGSQVNPIIVVMNAAHLAIARYTPTTPINTTITITNVTILKNIVGQGFSTTINATVANEGYYSETFNVTVYANSTIIGTLVNLTLASSNSATVPFTWNTGGFAKGNYAISVYVSMSSNDTNSLVGGRVTVTIPGDINGDSIVNILDAIKLGISFLATPDKPNWNPNADINDDGIVNILDAIILADHFLQHYP